MNDHFTLAQHFGELKRLICRVGLFFICAFIASYIYSEEILGVLLRPLVRSYDHPASHELIYTGLVEAFATYIQLSFAVALLASLPIISLQLFSFVMPALTKSERSFARFMLAAMPLLFIAGIAVAYVYAFPAAWRFFLSFESRNFAGLGVPLKLYIRLEEYLALAIQIMLAFGIAFQLPPLLVFLNRVGLLSVKILKAHRRLVIVLIFVIAAVITPPDALSQIILATLMILLYELSIVLCIILNSKSAK